MNDHSLSDLLPGYALGALSEDESAEVEAWLASSEEARAELREYRSTLVAVAALTPPRPVPDRLAADFARRLASEAEARRPARTPVRFRPGRILLGLAALLLLGFGLYALLRFTSSEAEARAIQAIRENPAATVIALVAQDGSAGKVTLIALPDGTQAVLAADLPALTTDKLYELWMIGDKPVPSGVFAMDQPSKDILVTLPGPLRDFKITAITVEPWSEKGSPLPTTKPIFAGEIHLNGT